MSQEWNADAAAVLRRRIEEDDRRVVILDDDPTGTQTVGGVDVILQPSAAAFEAFFRGSDRAVYVLTNTRAMPQAEAVSLLQDLIGDVRKAAALVNARVAFLLRGDSTLRGHVFAEIDVLASDDSVALFVPAFPQGGRFTIGGIHYLDTENGRVPVARTEFARDRTFGYTSERLTDWVSEVGGGRHCLSVSLEAIRAEGPEAIASVLASAPAGTVVIPDAETEQDLAIIALGLLKAEKRGRQVVVRSASSFAAVRVGLSGRIVPARAPGSAGRTLVVCGSHTTGAGKQLDALLAKMGVSPVVLPTAGILGDQRASVIDSVVAEVKAQLQQQKSAVFITERAVREGHGDLHTGSRLMEALIQVVRSVAASCDTVIAKGGITSAQVARDGLQAKTARVLGQLEPGVSQWQFQLEDGRQMLYAVIPGNVGREDTLVHVAEKMGVDVASSK